jgi:hypothetical protein
MAAQPTVSTWHRPRTEKEVRWFMEVVGAERSGIVDMAGLSGRGQ